jgi:hypothetical protein
MSGCGVLTRRSYAEVAGTNAVAVIVTRPSLNMQRSPEPQNAIPFIWAACLKARYSALCRCT